MPSLQKSASPWLPGFVVVLSIISLWLTPVTGLAQAPTITSFSPTTVCQGRNVTITGTDFTNVTGVEVNGLPAGFSVTNAGEIVATVNENATSGPIRIVTNQGTVVSGTQLTVIPSPKPNLNDNSGQGFSSCTGTATYTLQVSNASQVTGTGNQYTIDWGDGTAAFTATDWASGAQQSHTYNAQGYFNIRVTITPANGCTVTRNIQFYNGSNPLASFTTTASTTGLCAPAPVEFKIGNWTLNSPGTRYEIDFGDNTPRLVLNHPLNATNTDYIFSHIYNTTSCPGAADFTATLRAINGCFTTTYTLNQIIIRRKPVANFTFTPAQPCVTNQVCFNNTTVAGYMGNNCNSTTTYTWDFGDGTTSNALNPPCHTYAAAGTYNVTLTAGNTGCGTDAITRQIVVLPQSPPPTVTPLVYCQGATPAQLTATGINLRWYTSSSGGTGSVVAPTPGTNTAGTSTYYVTQTLPNQCESVRVPLTVTVNPLPPAPTVTTPVLLCLNQAATPLTATGSNLLWYDVANGGTGSATAPTPSTAATGSTNYWVSQTVNGCEGPRRMITVTVSPLPVAPVVTSPIIYCQFAPAVPLTAPGAGLLWYTTAVGGTGSTTAPTPSTATPGTTTWYVSQATGCGESPRAAIDVVVNPAPNASIAYTPNLLCNVDNSPAGTNPPVPVTFNGTTGGVFSISPGGMAITAAGSITPANATPGTYTITYSIPAGGGCPVYNTSATVTVNGTPTATISYPDLCTSGTPTAVTRTGSGGGTFSASPVGLTINAVTGVITPASSTPGTYTVTYDIAAAAPCPGYTATATLTVTAAPTATISYPANQLCNAGGAPVAVTQSGTGGGIYSVTPATGLTVDATTGQITPAGATAGVYTISYTAPGSGACAPVVATTNITVNGAPAATISYPAICSNDPLTPVVLTGSAGGTFSATPGISINATTGAINPAASAAGTYTVTYDIAAAGPCPGLTTTTTVNITTAPTATISYTPATLCNVANTPATPNAPVPVNRTGTPGGTFDVVPATGLPVNAVSGEINPAGATPGTYTIRYTAPGTGGCANYIATATVTVTGAPTATINYAGSPYCGNITMPQAVTITGTTGGVYSAAPGLSINPATGAINPAASTPGTYTVTYNIAASAPCPGFTTAATVQIVESPVISFPSPDQAICSGGSATYTPTSTVPGTTYTWTLAAPLPAGVNGTIAATANTSSATLTFTNTGTANQTITIRVTPTNPSPIACNGAPVNITLLVRPVVPAPVTTNASYCMDVPPQTLQVTPLPGMNIRWFDRNQAPLAAAPVINTAISGTSTFYVSHLTADNCESARSRIDAVVHPTLNIIGSAYVNPTSCGVPSGTITLDVRDLSNNLTPNLPVTVHYNKFGLPYSYSGTTNAAGMIVIPLTAGTYSNFRVETSGGCISRPLPDVFILRDPSPPAAPVAGYNPPVCSGAPLRLTALTATSEQAGPIEYVWAGPAFGPYADTVRNSVVIFPEATLAHAGTYVVYAMQNNCISLPANFQVAVNQAPAKPVVVTRSPLCVGEALTLQAFSSIPGNLALTYEWRGPATGFPVRAANAVINRVTLQDAGIYTITVTSPQTGCSTSTDTTIRIGDYPVVAFAQDTLTLPTGYRLQLEPQITNGAAPGVLPIAQYKWTPMQDLECNDAVCAMPVAVVKNNVCYNVQVTNVYGCSASDDICIRTFCDNSQVFIPNAFAPNGNVPENRVLMVRASGINAIKSFRVFNRWGQLMYERTNFPPNSAQFGWDGMIKGRKADVGVYVYTVEVVCENGVPYSYKGNVTLF
ncbi:PKD domain-containing protein [Chitinophaga horti]|uniref:PKD domain-containing protein n=1 Tax=Chitinophaga horti TaxID=2920382 RepID=A0ABY6J7Z5_9BACT|nr:PKD domain-containing protein [Chitinophaga horti]UYQ94427.1 PKD domain-containing protein [Chitinophaga horti]